MMFQKVLKSKIALIPLVKIEGRPSLEITSIMNSVFDEIEIILSVDNPLIIKVYIRHFHEMNNMLLGSNIQWIPNIKVNRGSFVISKRDWFDLTLEEALDISISINKVSPLMFIDYTPIDEDMNKYKL